MYFYGWHNSIQFYKSKPLLRNLISVFHRWPKMSMTSRLLTQTTTKYKPRKNKIKSIFTIFIQTIIMFLPIFVSFIFFFVLLSFWLFRFLVLLELHKEDRKIMKLFDWLTRLMSFHRKNIKTTNFPHRKFYPLRKDVVFHFLGKFNYKVLASHHSPVCAIHWEIERKSQFKQ